MRLPALIFLMCKNGANITGSAARFIVGACETFNDYDLIVPPDKWYAVSPLIPKTAKLNNHGGLKFNYRRKQIDIWPCSIEQHLRQCKPGLDEQEYVVDYVNNRIFTSTVIGTKNDR
jgi:hypothetical protein